MSHVFSLAAYLTLLLHCRAKNYTYSCHICRTWFNCFIITQEVRQNRQNNKVSKCELKKYLFRNKTRAEKPANFATQGLLLIIH